jgi:hypothetical protein
MLTGGCLCGGVRFEVDESGFESANYCHCTRCQRRTGAGASATVRIAAGAVRLTAGGDLVRSWEPDEGFAKAFCSECGAALFSHPPGDLSRLNVRFGAFDSDPGIRPQWRQFVAYAAPWEPIPDDGLPRYPEQRS